ncbi:MAG: iron ABC transporter permease [Spirochaetia bacterium]|nr:iron ABC transporter permease [Spirochaetia bacterium]
MKQGLQKHSKTGIILRFLLILGAAFFLFALDVFKGSVDIPLERVLGILFSPADWLSETSGLGLEQTGQRDIILLFRLPRAVTALLAGMGLALSGLFMQTLFRNPLAGPSVLGINAGANLGVALVVLVLGGAAGGFVAALPFGMKALVTGAAVVGAGAVLGVVLLVSRFIGSVTLLLLVGLMFGYLANSLVTLLIHFSAAGRVQAYLQWTFGSFGATTWKDIYIMMPVIGAAILLGILLIKPLNALLLGEEYARSMGVALIRVRMTVIMVGALLAGVVTAFCGPVTFVGVAVPHLARGIFRTADHRTLVPASLLLGGATALTADIVSHLPGQGGILPLNSVTALLGVPVVVWVLIRSRTGRSFV